VIANGSHPKVHRRLSYSPALVHLVHRLGLRRVLSRAYYWWACPPDGILRVHVDGVTGAFHIRTPWQLRWLESLTVNRDIDPDLNALLSTLRPGDIAYDIGANIGVFSVLMAKMVGADGQVVAFEPLPGVFEHLRANITLNALTNVRTLCIALSDVAGTSSMHTADESVLSSLESPAGADHRTEQIRMEIGDRLRAFEGLPIPCAVKIDVEGHESSVLRGLHETLRRPECRLVCCEIHPPILPPGVTEETVLAQIRDLGFGDVRIHKFPTWSVAICRKA
jgi:FkbM family methyltransferase